MKLLLASCICFMNTSSEFGMIDIPIKRVKQCDVTQVCAVLDINMYIQCRYQFGSPVQSFRSGREFLQNGNSSQDHFTATN